MPSKININMPRQGTQGLPSLEPLYPSHGNCLTPQPHSLCFPHVHTVLTPLNQTYSLLLCAAEETPLLLQALVPGASLLPCPSWPPSPKLQGTQSSAPINLSPLLQHLLSCLISLSLEGEDKTEYSSFLSSQHLVQCLTHGGHSIIIF